MTKKVFWCGPRSIAAHPKTYLPLRPWSPAATPRIISCIKTLDFDGIGDASGFQPSSQLTAFHGLAIIGTGNRLLIEVIVTSNDGNSEFAFDNFVVNGTVVAIPEPSSIVGLAVVAMGVVYHRRRRFVDAVLRL